jgi:hypothetical protein
MVFFGRIAKAQVDTFVIEGLRMAFKVDKDLGSDPNSLDLQIWNLAKTTRANLNKRHAAVVLEAGYKGQTSQIFGGESRVIAHTRANGVDWITRIQCGDGEKALRMSRCNLSLAPNTTLQAAFEQCCSQMGAKLGNVKDKAAGATLRGGGKQFPNGLSMSGKAGDVMDSLAAQAGMEWSIQDGAVQLLNPGEVAPGQVVSLSPDSGLVGSPEPGDKGVVRFRALLQPRIKPGSRFEVKSELVNGYFRAEKVKHQGDTHGAEFYTLIEAKPL